MARPINPIKTGARRAKTQRRAGQGCCPDCGEGRAEMLVRGSRPKRCLKCYARHNNKKTTETHHVAGEANSPITMETPIMDHKTLSEGQLEWPPGVLSNADGSPLLAAAGYLCGAADFIEHLVVNGLRYIADFLQRLDTWLREHVNPIWWKSTDFDGWQPA